MTTIAYRDGVLAGDTLITAGDTKLPGVHRKVWKLRNGCLFGAAGSNEQIAILKRSVLKGETPPTLDDIQAILIRPDGSVDYFEGAAWVREPKGYYSIGSGAPYAMTAMWLKHDAKTAVRAGIQFDTASGGRVIAVKLTPPLEAQMGL